MTRRSTVFDLIDTMRNLGRAADSVARVAEDAAQARAEGLCVVCGQSAALPGADYCDGCKVGAVKAGAGAAKSAIDRIAETLISRR